MEETRGKMPSKREIFSISGPLHLNVTDWANPEHRRSIAASLVQGTYILERDRQQNRRGPQALAPHWWEFFHFRLVHVLVDDKDLSIFGAVYEFKYPPCYHKPPAHNPPRYVIAFRGTITKPDTRSLDLKLDLHFIFNRLQKSPRYNIAMKCVQEIVALALPQNVWLAGHSLGSALALTAGKNMVKDSGSYIETYLFNPPFTSVPLEKIKCSKIKYGVRFANSIITAGVAAAVNGLKQSSENNVTSSFHVLSNWVPYLFVNPNDPICSEYIGYFEHRLKMMAIGDGSLGRLATQNSIGSLLSGKSSEPDHLLPSAYLCINMSPSESLMKAHGIHQWWEPNIPCEFKLHQYKMNYPFRFIQQ